MTASLARIGARARAFMLVLAVGVPPAVAAAARTRPAVAPVAPLAASAPDTLTASQLAIRRAVAETRFGHSGEVVRLLSRLDWTSPPATTDGDRALYLYGEALLAEGSLTPFDSLASAVRRWPVRGPWAARLLAEAGRIGRPAAQASTTGETDVTTARDLLGADEMRDALERMQRGADPSPALARVPAGAAQSPQARHVAGLRALESGDLAAGSSALESVLADAPDYAARRDVLTALAARQMDAGHWQAAHDLYARADQDWHVQSEALRARLARGGDTDLWQRWEARPVPAGGPLVSVEAARRAAAARAVDALGVALPTAPAAVPAPADSARVQPPSADAWAALEAAARRAADADGNARDDARTLAGAREDRRELQEWWRTGLTHARAEQSDLETRRARLDSLRSRLDALDARLQQLRDDARRQLGARAEKLLDASRGNERWLAGLRHWHLDGVDAVPASPGHPGPAEVVAREEELARAIDGAAADLAARLPALLDRSYREGWGPNLVDRVVRQGHDAGEALAWSRQLGASFDSSLASGDGARVRALIALSASSRRRADSLAVAHQRLRETLARDAVRGTLAAMELEREGLDYGLASAAYASAVQFDRADSAGVFAARPVVDDSTLDEPVARQWRAEALGRLQAFLVQHPHSASRAPVRFELADVELLDARARFQDRMRAFLHGGGALPVLETGPALAIYRQILRDDPDFVHTDAVLFNAGSVRADAGDAGAFDDFHTLVEQHPDSRYVQEALLRMGDMRFAGKDWAACAPLFERAAQGADSTIRRIALYKLGWANLQREQFLAGADAFRGVLDLEQVRTGEDKLKLGEESEALFVFAIARAGGAPAYARYFDGVGERPYDVRVLRALGQHFRRYSLYADAAATDKLLIARHPDSPDALLAAERMAETYHRWDRPELERAALAENAPRFAPKGDWAKAQASDSVRAEGERFARGAWTSLAHQHHLSALSGGGANEWREALSLYERVLGTWPKDPGNAAMQLAASDASEQLGDPLGALEHAHGAASAGDDSLRAQAAWRRVAILDAWYERTRPRDAKTATGSDSLATAVRDAAADMRKHFPDDARVGDLIWRSANLAFAHGWYEPAADDFAHLVQDRPRDARAPRAAMLHADALYRLGRFDDAGAGYADAAKVARAAGVDSLARRADAAVPACAYRAAEAMGVADSTRPKRQAEAFEHMADTYPDNRLAPLARYRAGLAWRKADEPRNAVRAFEALLRDAPNSEYRRDAQLEIAKGWEAAGEPLRAARADAEFAAHYPADPQADAALLAGGDLAEKAGVVATADTLRLAWIRRHPADDAAAMALLEPMARRELDAVGPAHPLAGLLGRARNAALASRLGDYLARARRRPELASREVLAHVDFLTADEGWNAYVALPMRQPLPAAIAAKQKRMDELVKRYRAVVDRGDATWAHAATWRIGGALIAFGDALAASERPRDLKGDDRKAYDDVIAKQADLFARRGEDVWSQMVRPWTAPQIEDAWLSRARAELWPRLATRFVLRAEDRDAPADSTRDEAALALARARNAEGIERLHHGDVAAARRAFTEAATRDDRLPGPCYNLAVIEKFFLGNDAGAADWWARYRALAAEDPDGIAAAFADTPERPLAQQRSSR